MTAQEILALLTEPCEDIRPSYWRIVRQAHVKAIIAALNGATDPLVRQLIVDILGIRRARSAVPVLIPLLADPNPGLRGSAADALGKIGDIRAGPALLRQYQVEPDLGLKELLLAGFGGVGFQEAAAVLIAALLSGTPGMQRVAAWSIGKLRLEEARGALVEVLDREIDDYTASRVQDALDSLV